MNDGLLSTSSNEEDARLQRILYKEIRLRQRRAAERFIMHEDEQEVDF